MNMSTTQVMIKINMLKTHFFPINNTSLQNLRLQTQIAKIPSTTSKRPLPAIIPKTKILDQFYFLVRTAVS